MGFASKAGKLGFGMQAAVTCLRQGKSSLVVTACDISPKSQKEVLFFAHSKNVPQITFKEISIKMMSDAVGKKCGIISVNDGGFADAICNITGGNANDQ